VPASAEFSGAGTPRRMRLIPPAKRRTPLPISSIVRSGWQNHFLLPYMCIADLNPLNHAH
jgi:hypothetical protein